MISWAKNTARGVRILLRFNMYLFLAQCEQVYLLLALALYFFFSSFPFSIFRFGHRLFDPDLFLWVLGCFLGFGFCCDNFSMISISPRRCADSPFHFCLRYTTCFSYCVYYLLFYAMYGVFVFLLRYSSTPELLQPLSGDHRLHYTVAMS